MRRLEEIEQALDAAKKKQTELQTRLAESTAKLAQKKDAYADRVRQGAAEAELDELDAALFKIDRERARIEIRLDQAREEIEQLLGEREAAYVEQQRIDLRETAQALLDGAQKIEAAVQTVITLAAPHAALLAQARQQAEALGVQQVPFRLSNLEHRVTAAFRNSSDRTYKQSYETIIASNIASVEKQIGVKSDDLQPKQLNGTGNPEPNEAIN